MFNEILEKLQLILKNNTLLADVYDWENIQTDSDPFAVIIPSGNESDYQTTEENVRTYGFTIMLFVSRTIRSTKDAERVLRQLVDSVIDDFDKDSMLTTIGQPEKSGYTFLQVFATPSVWGYALPDDKYRVATINLRAMASVDLNNIS
jgi:hypothetical protein